MEVDIISDIKQEAVAAESNRLEGFQTISREEVALETNMNEDMSEIVRCMKV